MSTQKRRRGRRLAVPAEDIDLALRVVRDEITMEDLKRIRQKPSTSCYVFMARAQMCHLRQLAGIDVGEDA
jgi:hypothetical protein